MALTRREIGLAAVVVTVVACATVYLLSARKANQRRMDLGACLVGEPLTVGEKASARMERLELGRQPTRTGEASVWPESCTPLAAAAAGSWLVRGTERTSLERLAQLLGDKESTSAERAGAADGFTWLEQRLPLAGGAVRPPWKPVTFLEAPPGGRAPLPCNYFNTGEDDMAVLAGDRGARCVVVAEGAERLAKLRVATPEEAKPRPSKRRAMESALTSARATARDSCSTSAGRFLVTTPSDRRTKRHEVVVEIWDAEGNALAPASTVVTSRFQDREENANRSLDSSEVMVTCRAHEARVSWSWATSIDGLPNEEIVVLECVPGRCDTRTGVVHIETSRHSNCGWCRPTDDQMQVVPPSTVDLFGSIAVFWRDHHGLRTRVAPLDRLDAMTDQFLWYEANYEHAYFHQPMIETHGDIALMLLEREADKTGLATPGQRFFRLAPTGWRELTMAQ